MGANGEQAAQIKSNVESGQLQLLVMGQELIWLSEVLPKGAQGDWNDFLNTGTLARTQGIEYLRLLDPIFQSMGERDLLNYVMTTVNDYQPYLEYQTAIMVSWFF